MSDEIKINNETGNYSVDRGRQTYALEMKMKRHNLGTESCLSASNEIGSEGENHHLFHIVHNSSLSTTFINISVPRFISLQRFHPLFVNSPEKMSDQQKFA